MPMRGIPNKLNREPIILLLQHAKRLSEAQISHHVKSQIIAPIRHILAQTPPLPFLTHNLGACSQALGKGTHVLQNVTLHGLHGAFREGVREDAALARVLRLVDAAVCVVGVLVGGEGSVEVGLLDRGVEAVDAVQGRGGVGGEGVGSVADEGTW